MTQSAHIGITPDNSLRYRHQTMKKILLAVRNMFLLLLYRYTPLKPGEKSVADIFNFMAVTDQVACSGQPTAGQFKWIKKAGYQVVIDLTTDDFIDNTLENEHDIVTGLGMIYVHIPVDFYNPQPEGFQRFVRTMRALSGEKVWVHCLVNARASSFIFKYRTTILGEDREDALWDLREIWEPFGPWKEFVYKGNFDRFFPANPSA